MIYVKTVVTSLLLVLFLSVSSYAKEWRGIVPLHSSCEDVKRILNVTTCESSIYHLEEETAVILFSGHPCDSDGWNVPPNTVISIDVYPKKRLPLRDFGIDEAKYKKVVDNHVVGYIYYIDEVEGFTLSVDSTQEIMSFTYTPAAKDNYLRCPGSYRNQPVEDDHFPLALKIDEYGDLNFDKEKKRLDDFARQLRLYKSDTQGYIIAYGGRHGRAGEAQERAERAKIYLVTKQGIERDRIVTVDGGYREEFTIELWVRPPGFGAPIPRPTVHPSNIGGAGNGKRRSNCHGLPKRV
jgi:hypothetical protein